MSQIDDSGIERRFQRNTYVVIGGALIAGWFLSGWRMALGVTLGGALCLFNIRWLGGSVRAILSNAVVMPQRRRVPPFTASKLILRYFVIAIVIVVALSIGYFHPLGIAIGFAAFAGGVMVEAAYQLYLFFKAGENARENSSKE